MTAEAEIRRRIAARGPVTFAEFMEIALYHPGVGYYTGGERVGAAGDFYTSPSAHPAFGALLAVQLLQMWELLDCPSTFTVVEPGAGNGLLCRDIATAAGGLDAGFAHSLQYLCLDRRMAGGCDRDLPGVISSVIPAVNRVAAAGLPLRGIVGCVLSNELLDAFPVHQVTMKEGRLLETYVTLHRNELAFQTGEPSTPLLARRLTDLGVVLTEGQIAEVNLALDGWVESAARALERGFVLTIDYGRAAAELYSSTDRFRGTLTTFYNHLQTDRPLERAGRQDMSAQVDFTTLAQAGTRAGLDLLGHASQGAFLNNLGLEQLGRRLPRQTLSGRVGMRELAKPGGLGDFKVMAHGKNVGNPELWGFRPSEQALELATRMPLPLPAQEHINLPEGRYPSADAEFEMSWDRIWPADPC